MTNQQAACNCKIGRVTTDYEMQTIDSYLVENWQSGRSIRRLTEDFNKKLIESKLTSANLGHVKWSRTPVYEALCTDELSEADTIEIRRDLDRNGINVEQLSSDLVSHQTVYRHLTNCVGASKDDDQTTTERREKAKNTVHALQQRTEIVTESTIETLRSAGITDLGEVNVLVDLHVVCRDCDQSMDFERAITDGCDCDGA